MTATDVLRHMLDERGVEWWEATPCKTKWSSPILGGPVAAREWNGEMVLDTGYTAVTPEQAIAATLGSCNCSDNCTNGERTETCKRVFYEPTGVYVCSKCGRGLSKKLDKYCYLHYCPNCGRRVEQ